MTGRVAALGWLVVLWGHDAPTTKLTWNREISRLVLKRCAGCHQSGGAAPFPLTTFAEARPWAVAIKEEVLMRRMPPWPAAKGFGEFSNDLSMPQEEINRLAEWAEGGAPEGEAQYFRPVFAVPPWRPERLPAGRQIRLSGRMTESVVVLAIRGEGIGKTWAEVADGSVRPLVWFTGVKGKGPAPWLRYREPVRLPAGAVVRGAGAVVIVR